jgi:hypothetical protein
MKTKGRFPAPDQQTEAARWSALSKAEPVVVGATDRPLDHNPGIGPRVMIVRRNIVELALDFHGHARDQSPRMDWTHVATFFAECRSAHVEPQQHLPDDR